MRAVLQRVVQASVEVNGQQVSKIKQGLCVLIGLSVDDTSADLDYMVRKLLSVRVFDSNQGPSPSTPVANATVPVEESPARMWAKSVVDIGGEILCVSQFTLYGQVIKGSKPDFHLSMKSDTSKQMYHDFLERLKKAYTAEKIKDGEFGAMMLVNIANDGPVTLELDSRKFEYVPVTNQSSPAVAKVMKHEKASQPKAPNSSSKKQHKEGKGKQAGLNGSSEAVAPSVEAPSADMAKMDLNVSEESSRKLKPTCVAVAEDGLQLYALASGYDTSIKFGQPGSDTRYILLKSDARPASLLETRWAVVSSFKKSSLNILSGISANTVACAVSPTGVFTILDAYGIPPNLPPSAGGSPMQMNPVGIRYDPGLDTNNGAVSASGPGGWANITPNTIVDSFMSFTYNPSSNMFYVVGALSTSLTTTVLGMPMPSDAKLISVPTAAGGLKSYSYTLPPTTGYPAGCQTAFPVLATVFKDSFYMLCVNQATGATTNWASQLYTISSLNSSTTLGAPLSLSSDFKPAAFDRLEPVDGASGMFAVLHDMSSMHSSIVLTGSKTGSYWKPSFYYANVTTSFDDIPSNNGVVDEGGDGGGGSSNLSTGAIAGIVAGVIVVIGFLFWWCRSGHENVEEKGGDGRFEEHKGEYLDPDGPEVIKTYLDPDGPEVIKTYQDQLQGELQFSRHPRPNFTTTVGNSNGAEEPPLTASNWEDKKPPYPQGTELPDRNSPSPAAGTRAPQTIQRSNNPQYRGQ
ncbi:D-tyrosyl-tRNA(Tyr) deacylase [Podila clonocystis]|nr:D-tyrosyl-tRNA(Tyr) deacylase [Podila clonocystis]